jgi:hypothetical protein
LTAALAASALVAFLALSCWTPRTRVLHTPEVAGRVIDYETREPVVGAEVFVSLWEHTKGGLHGAIAILDTRWTTTDAEGRFRFAPFDTPVPEDMQRWTHLSELPVVTVIHPRYGRSQTTGDITDFSNIEWEAVVDQYTLEGLARPGGYHSVCTSLGRDGFYHCCKVFFGPGSSCLPSSGSPR